VEKYACNHFGEVDVQKNKATEKEKKWSNQREI